MGAYFTQFIIFWLCLTDFDWEKTVKRLKFSQDFFSGDGLGMGGCGPPLSGNRTFL